MLRIATEVLHYTHDERIARKEAEIMLNQKELTDLETIVDIYGMSAVVEALGSIATEKADHLRSNWQDNEGGRAWDRAARCIGKTCIEKTAFAKSAIVAENKALRVILVKLVIETEYAHGKMGDDRSLTRSLMISDARKLLGWKSFESSAA